MLVFLNWFREEMKPMQLVQNFAGEICDSHYEENLFERIARALKEAGVTNDNTALRPPPRLGHPYVIFIHETLGTRSAFIPIVKPRHYVLQYSEKASTFLLSDFSTEELKAENYNDFIDVIKKVLAFRYPSSAVGGRLERVMETFKKRPQLRIVAGTEVDRIYPPLPLSWAQDLINLTF